MIVVSDTTPIISLLKIGKLEIMKDLFAEVKIPKAVFDELTTNERFENEAEEIRNCPFIQTVEVHDKRAVDLIRRIEGLDLGESEAIVLSDIINAQLLIVDEAKARDVARSMGLKITGTVGLLLAAYNQKILSKENIIDCIKELRDSGRHIGERYFHMLLDRINRD